MLLVNIAQITFCTHHKKRMSLVRANQADVVHSELLKFCVANLASEQAKTAADPNNREAREKVKTYRTMLVDEMQRSGVSTVRLPAGNGCDRDSWVILKPRTKAKRKLCPGSVAELMGSMSMENIDPERGSLLRAIEEYLRSHMKPEPNGEYTVSVQTCTPRTARQNPSLPSETVNRVASNFIKCTQEAKAVRKHLKSEMEPHERVCQSTQASVQKYIENINPEAGVAPLQVDLQGQSMKFYVRTREVRRGRALSLKTLLEMSIEVMGHLLRHENIADDITPGGVERLRSAEMRARMFELLQERVAKFKSDNMRVTRKVTLERGVVNG